MANQFFKRVTTLNIQFIAKRIAAAVTVTAVAFASSSAFAQITVDAAWSRATIPTTPIGVAYLTVTNKSNDGDVLIAASFVGAGRVELHEHIKQGDVMQMRQVKTIAVPAGQSVKLQPSGLHLMLMELKEPLKAGTTIALVLKFERAGEVKVDAVVRKLGDRGPDDPTHHGPAAK